MKVKTIGLYAMTVFYVLAGIRHFTHTAFYLQIMPPYIPEPLNMVYLSGAFEILLGLLLLPVMTRRLAAWGLIALLIAVFPANLHMYMNNISPEGTTIPPWALYARLPLQLLLIYWAYFYAKRTEKNIFY
jgi:uncharacterized membrane protein